MHKIYYVTVAMEVRESSAEDPHHIDSEVIAEMDYNFHYNNPIKGVEIIDTEIRNVEVKEEGSLI